MENVNNRIQKAFQNHKAFIPFITVGDPDIDTTKDVVRAAVAAGADLIELGIPFSDPHHRHAELSGHLPPATPGPIP